MLKKIFYVAIFICTTIALIGLVHDGYKKMNPKVGEVRQFDDFAGRYDGNNKWSVIKNCDDGNVKIDFNWTIEIDRLRLLFE